MGEVQAWVGCLACYNGGRLNGEWLTADEAAGPLALTAPKLARVGYYGNGPAGSGAAFDQCRRCGADEWWCFDLEGVPAAFVGEMSPVAFAELGQVLDDLDDDERAAFGAWCSMTGNGPAEVAEFREEFQGVWSSEAEYAEDLAEESGDVRPDLWPWYCIDWDAAARDLFAGGDAWAERIAGGVAVFRSC